MIYVMLLTFFLKSGMVLTSTTTTHSKWECEDFSVLVVKDEIARKYKDDEIGWIDVQCVKVSKPAI